MCSLILKFKKNFGKTGNLNFLADFSLTYFIVLTVYAFQVAAAEEYCYAAAAAAYTGFFPEMKCRTGKPWGCAGFAKAGFLRPVNAALPWAKLTFFKFFHISKLRLMLLSHTDFRPKLPDSQ
jgi:hypothetical protein